MIVTSFSLCAFPFRGRFTLCSFENIPHLSKGKKSGCWTPHDLMFYILFTKINFVSSWAEVICPHLYKGLQRVLAQPKSVQFTNCLREPLYYICRFVRGSLQVKIATPSLYKGLRMGNWANKFINSPHLIATRMAFWLGVFPKIQSMFTNSLSPNSLEKKQNLRLQRKYPHLLP